MSTIRLKIVFDALEPNEQEVLTNQRYGSKEIISRIQDVLQEHSFRRYTFTPAIQQYVIGHIITIEIDAT